MIWLDYEARKSMQMEQQRKEEAEVGNMKVNEKLMQLEQTLTAQQNKGKEKATTVKYHEISRK